MIIGYMKIIWSFLRKVTIEKLLISYEANLNEVIIIYILLGLNKSNILGLYDNFGYNLNFSSRWSYHLSDYIFWN